MSDTKSSNDSSQESNQEDRRIAATDQAIVVAEGAQLDIRDVSDAIARDAIYHTSLMGQRGVYENRLVAEKALTEYSGLAGESFDAWSRIVDRALDTADGAYQESTRQVSDVVQTASTLVSSANDRAFDATRTEAGQSLDRVTSLFMVVAVAAAGAFVLRGGVK